MLIIGFIALALFVGCSFWVTRLAERIRERLKQHSALFQRVGPSTTDHWYKHWVLQNPVNFAFAALPFIKGAGDPELERNVSDFKIAVRASLATWAVMAIAFWVAFER